MKGLTHPATIIASLALFVALGGTSLAAASYINGSRIRNHTIAETKLTKNAIKALGPSNAESAYAPTYIPVGQESFTTVASLTLAAGSYLITAKSVIFSTSSQGGSCALTDSSAGMIDRNVAQGNLYATPSLAAPLKTKGSTVSLQCEGLSNDAQVGFSHLMATRLGSVTGS